jgi:hypothetical protein
MVSRNRIGFLLFFSALLWVALAVGRPMQGAPAAQAAPCLSQTVNGFVFALQGYQANGDGRYTLTWQVTNHNKQDMGYVALGTGPWQRSQPPTASRYTGALGAYRIEWTNERGNPGFPSVKYETQFSGFHQGASETFTLTVQDFDPATTIQVQAKAGRTVGTAQFIPSTGACDRTPPTPTPTTPFSPLPTPTPTPEGYTLPAEPVVAACLFAPPPSGIIEEPIIPLSAYTFSEPQVVLTNTAPIGIQQWLPDSERLLVTRHTGKGNMLELVNTRTRAITRLVEPNRAIKAPRWLNQDQTVVWVELGGGTYEPGHWLRSFDPMGERHLSGDGTGAGIAHDVAPDGQQVVFLALPGGTQPLLWHQERKTLRALPIDLAGWRYGGPIFYRLQPFNVQWHPGGEKLLFWDGTWIFLYDLTTGQGCEIQVRALTKRYWSVHEASWSPNGRYLLLKNAEWPPYQSTHGPHDLVLVLDTYTGEAVQYALGHPVWNFAWVPDSQTVAMLGSTEQEIQVPAVGLVQSQGLYLLNVRSGELQPILPAYFAGGSPGLAWSPDGTRLAFLGSLLDGFGTAGHAGGLLVSQVTLNH